MRFEVAPLPLDVVVCFFLWTGIVPSLWEFVWNVSRNGICLYYYLVYPSLGRLYFTHNSGWHPTPVPATIAASPSSSTVTVGTPFNVDVTASAEQAFNAAKATVTVSSNLSITGISYPTTNSCNFNYTTRPSTTNASFAGAIFGGSSTGCTAYT